MRSNTLSGVANSFASFRLDWPATVTRDLKVIDEPGTRHWAISGFIHDKWQARPNVTVDLGLRREYYDPLQGIEGQGTLANYDPSTNTIRVAGYGDTDLALNVKKTFTNFAPRTGVSWRLDDLTVVRGGYGVGVIPFPDNRYAFNYPVKSQYHGLQVKVDRRFRNGFMVTNSYTLSRSWDYVNENTTIGTPIDRQLSWGRSNFDRTHNYALSAIYELPWGPAKPWLKEGLAATIPGGWQVSGLLVVQSGTPLTITGNGTQLNTPGNTAFANLDGEHKVLGGLGPGNRYFDPSVYSLPAAGQQGNLRRNNGPEGPGFRQLDMSIFKRFQFGTSGRYAEFRIDMYNAPNAVRWGNPSTGFSTATGNTFGQITGLAGQTTQRMIRFGGRVAF